MNPAVFHDTTAETLSRFRSHLKDDPDLDGLADQLDGLDLSPGPAFEGFEDAFCLKGLGSDPELLAANRAYTRTSRAMSQGRLTYMVHM